VLPTLHVCTMISNPVRYQSRYRLYWDFAEHMRESGVDLWTVEVAFGHRPFTVTSATNPRHLQLRTHTELWHKENALNLLVQRIPLTSPREAVAWIDADIRFEDPSRWVEETQHALQHSPIVQLWQSAVDLGPDNEVIQTHQGFAYAYRSGKPYGKGYSHWHPGYGWAMTREAWDHTGGLIDWAVAGAADNHMAHAWIGRVDDSCNPAVSAAYRAGLKAYQDQASRYIRANLGFVPGTIRHYWHGRKVDRRYWDRWRILTSNHFSPVTDLKRDHQGLLQLADHGDARSQAIRDQLWSYFRARAEDANTVA
jgi:hypothetical protein